MKTKALFVGFFLISTAYTISAVSISYVTCQELARNMDYLSGKDGFRWYLINVLPRYICAECTIPGSINIPVHLLDKKLKSSQKWPRDRKIIVCCVGGVSPLSRYAYEIIKNLGFDDVHILEGGMSAWKNYGYSVIGKCRAGYLGAQL